MKSIEVIYQKFIGKRISTLSYRDLRLILSIFTSALQKGCSVIVTLITMPITLKYLGTEQFSIWMVISSLITFMSFSDLGIGMGLQNALSKSYGKEDTKTPKYLISSAYFLMMLVLVIFLSLGFLIYKFIPISNLFKLESYDNLIIAQNTLYSCFLLFLVGVPVALIQRVLTGFQKTYIANNILLFGNLLSLIFILLSIKYDLGLYWLCVLFFLAPKLCMFIYSVFYFSLNFELVPRPKYVRVTYLKAVMNTGLWTVFVQILYTLKMSVPVLIVSSCIGSVAVAEFSIAQKLVAVGTMIINVSMQPLWTVYGEAYYRGDKLWVKKTLTKSIKMVLIITILMSVIFVFFGINIIKIWIGSNVLPSRELISGFSLWMIVSSINICFAMIMNGTGNFKRQAMVSCILITAALTLAYLTSFYVGMIGIVLSLAIVAEFIRIPFFYKETRRIIIGMKSEAI